MSQKYYTSERNVQIMIVLLKQYGIRHIIASPGTTNLTFVGSLQQDPYFKIYSAPEERSAAYMAVGMAEELNEPVVITCTGATASRNYMPGMTEAFYRKLPVLAITATQPAGSVGQHVPQVIDRSILPKDVATYSVHLGLVKDSGDENTVVLKANEALHYLTKAGGGPVHINLETSYSKDFSVRELPLVPKICYYRYFDALPDIPVGKVGIYVGSHSRMTRNLTEAIDAFCEKYGGVVFCDHTSNYKGRYGFLCPLVLSQDNAHFSATDLDLMIHIGDISGSYTRPRSKEIWRVNPDGIIRSVYGLPTAVFEMREEDFFNSYQDESAEKRPSFLSACQEAYNELYELIPEKLLFSNIWIARQLAPCIPAGAVMHFGILNSLRSWNFFELSADIYGYSNVGGFGIDGPISTAIGGALAQPDRLHFLIVGDLAFFYDLNSLGNRHIPNNIRILLINNGRGTEFTNYNHPAYAFGEQADAYMAAAGHYGRKSKWLVKHLSEDFGFAYMSADDKEGVNLRLADFTNPAMADTPMVFEVFTDSANETEALHTIRNLKTDSGSLLQNKIRSAVGKKGVDAIKKIIGR